MSATSSPIEQGLRSYRGIRLGLFSFNTPVTRYRVRVGRDVAFTTVAGLNREWLDIYIRWHQSRGEHGEASSLRMAWLTTSKVKIADELRSPL